METVFWIAIAAVAIVALVARYDPPAPPRKQLEAVPPVCYIVHRDRSECAVHGLDFVEDCEYSRR